VIVEEPAKIEAPAEEDPYAFTPVEVEPAPLKIQEN